jgi:hypothetical protein
MMTIINIISTVLYNTKQHAVKHWIHFYSLNTNFRGFHWFNLTIKKESAEKKTITKKKSFTSIKTMNANVNDHLSFCQSTTFDTTENKWTPVSFCIVMYICIWAITLNLHNWICLIANYRIVQLMHFDRDLPNQ